MFASCISDSEKKGTRMSGEERELGGNSKGKNSFNK